MTDFSSNSAARDPHENPIGGFSEGSDQASGGLTPQQPYPRATPAEPPTFGYYPPPPGSSSLTPTNTGTRGMYTAAAVLNWITYALFSVATFGIGLVAGFWVIPMTIAIHKAAKGPYKHTALGVCTLLFINLISGILILVDDNNRPAGRV